MAVNVTSKASLLNETQYTREDRERVIQEIKELGLVGKELVDKIKEENCKMVIPTKKNLYELAEKHPDSVIAAGISRVQRVLDESHHLYSGFSGGKDSTISANLLLLELNLRYMRYALGVDRDGNMEVDILDAKWAKHNKKIWMQMQDAEVVFTMTNDYSKRFLKKYGPEGLNLLEFNWYCLQMSWQSGVDFDSGVLVSWDENKEAAWVQPMPSRTELHGFDVVSERNFKEANAVALDSLPVESQEFHKQEGNVVMVPRRNIFGIDLTQPNTKAYWDEEVPAVCNFGRGPLTFYKPFDHEKDFNHDFSYWFTQTSWLVDHNSIEDLENIQKAIGKRYDMTKDVWRMTPAVAE